jgi:prepilin-type N-terminal cleavage/methylation domain-containing protein
MKSRRQRPGFTLVEIIISLAVMLVLTYGVYSMLIQGTKTATQGIWRTTTGRRLQVGVERLRKALTAASFPAMVTPEFNLIDSDARHYIVLGKGAGPVGRDLEITEAQDQADQDSTSGAEYYALGAGREGGADENGEAAQFVLAASSCTPSQKRLPGLPEQDGQAQTTVFWLSNARPVLRGGLFVAVQDLMYATNKVAYGTGDVLTTGNTIAVTGHPLGAIPANGKILIPDVNSVRIRVTYFDPAANAGAGAFVESTDPVSPDKKPTLELGIRCVDPDSGKAVLSKLLKVQCNAGLKFQ